MTQKVFILSMMIFGCFSTMMAQDFHEVMDLDIELGWDNATVVEELDSDFKLVKEEENRSEYSGGEFENTELVRTYLDYNERGYLENVVMVLVSQGHQLENEEVYLELEDEYGEPHFSDLSPDRPSVFTTGDMLKHGLQVPDEFTSRGYAGWAGVNKTPITVYNKIRIYVQLVEHSSSQQFLIVVYGYTSDRTETVDYPNGRVEKCTFYINEKKSKSIGWYESGQREYEEVYVDGELSEERTTFYKDGSKKSVTTYIKGQKNGEDVYWYENGNKQKEGAWKDDKGDGKWTYWYESGKKQKEGGWNDGKEDGEWVYWYENGVKQEEGAWKDGKKDGKWVYWCENGEKKEEGEWKDDEIVGKWVYWYENGKKKEEGGWKEGKKTGKWVYWYENGVKQEEGAWKDGKKDGKWVYWCENGKKEQEGGFKEDKAEGKWVYWYENGNIKSEGEWKDGVQEGKWNAWYTNGQMQCEGRRKAGKQDGNWVFWFENGKKKSEGSWKDGVQEGKWVFYNESGDETEIAEFINDEKVKVLYSITDKYKFASTRDAEQWLDKTVWSYSNEGQGMNRVAIHMAFKRGRMDIYFEHMRKEYNFYYRVRSVNRNEMTVALELISGSQEAWDVTMTRVGTNKLLYDDLTYTKK
jgi:antitoxin component YwqK of YwqJK toxin-antitoxin module